MIVLGHFVICQYCGEKFDRDTVPFEKINQNRYAHKLCSDKNNGRLTKESRDRKELCEYIKKLYGVKEVSLKAIRQMEKYAEEYHYTYSGMLKTLIYAFEIKKIKRDKMNEGIGIIPYFYDETRKYYQAIWLANQKNAGKSLKSYAKKTVQTIIISPPQREPIKSKKFSFLDEDIELE